MNFNFFGEVQADVARLITSFSYLFAGYAAGISAVFGSILIAVTGVQIAFGRFEGGVKPMLVQRAVALIAVKFMLAYYVLPIPGIGISFHNVVIDQGVWMSQQIDTGNTQLLMTSLDAAVGSPVLVWMQGPGAVIRYGAFYLAVWLMKVSVFAVISFGFVALGVLILVGPVCIPFLLFAPLDWIFWGWLKALLQYSWYSVIAFAYVYVFSQFMVSFWQAHAGQSWSTILVNSPGLTAEFCCMGLAFVFGLLRVPSLVSSLFSGRSGDHAMPGIGAWR